jgi:tetratricopeptide (TPR) repeat protein
VAYCQRRFAYRWRADEHIGKTEYDRAIVDCFSSVRIDLLCTEARVARVFDESDYNAAIAGLDADLDEVFQHNPHEAGAHLRRGLVCLREGDLDKAIEYLDEAVRRHREDRAAWNYRGVAHFGAGLYEFARDDFDEVGRLDGDEPGRLDVVIEADRAVVIIRRLDGDETDDDRSIEDLDAAIGQNPHETGAHLRRGVAHICKGEFDKAIADLDAVIAPTLLDRSSLMPWDLGPDLGPKVAAAYFCRGVAYGGKGHYDAAIAEFDEAVRLNPENAAGYYCRARSHLGKARAQADADFEEAKRCGYPAIWWKRASAGPAKEPDRDRINDKLSQQADADSEEAEGHGSPAICPEASEGPANSNGTTAPAVDPAHLAALLALAEAELAKHGG